MEEVIVLALDWNCLQKQFTVHSTNAVRAIVFMQNAHLQLLSKLNSKLLFSALTSMWKTTCAVAGAISFDCLLYWVSVWLQYKQRHQLLFRCIPDKSSCSVRVSCTHRCSAARASLTTWRDTSGSHVRKSINFLFDIFSRRNIHSGKKEHYVSSYSAQQLLWINDQSAN